MTYNCVERDAKPYSLTHSLTHSLQMLQEKLYLTQVHSNLVVVHSIKGIVILSETFKLLSLFVLFFGILRV